MHRAVVVLLLALTASVAVADIPRMMNVQGLLTDNQGQALPDGSYTVMFRIYDSEMGGSPVWTEERTIATSAGLFVVYLGQVTPLPSSLFDNPDLWLGMAIESDAEMAPRQRLSAVPYVFRAIRADSTDFAFTVAENSIGSDQIVDGSIRLSDLHRSSAMTDQVIKWNGSAWAAADDETGSSDGGGWVRELTTVRLQNLSDNVGIGVTNPEEKLHVAGDIRVGIGNDVVFGDDNTRIYETGGDLIVTADDDLHLQPDDNIYIRKDGASAWVHFDNAAERLGVGLTNPTYKLTVDGEVAIANLGETKYHINYYQGGLNIAETGVEDRRIHIGDGGNVGIGTANPAAKLGVNGDLRVTGSFRGDQSSTSGSDGAPFPRPTYNSGWVTVAQGGSLVLTHDIGGDSSNYVVDLQFRSGSENGINNLGVGGDFSYASGSGKAYGGGYRKVTSRTITLERYTDDFLVGQMRVRIWVIE